MIYTLKENLDLIRKGTNLVCTKIIFRGFEISISMDDSWGALKQLSRTNIRVYKGKHFEEDVSDFFGFNTDSEDLFSIMSRIDKFKEKEIKK